MESWFLHSHIPSKFDVFDPAIHHSHSSLQGKLCSPLSIYFFIFREQLGCDMMVILSKCLVLQRIFFINVACYEHYE